MFKIKDTVYADFGNLLKGKHVIAFQSKGSLDDFTEEAIDLTDMSFENGVIYCHGRKLRWLIDEGMDYARLKRKFISMRYSIDDQIAIILDKDDSEEDALAYEKMQEWRAWASLVAHKVMEVINQQKEEDNEDNL